MTNRHARLLARAAACTALLASVTPVVRSQVTTAPLPELTVHAMNRMAYGGTPSEIQSITTLGHLATWMSLQVQGTAPQSADLLRAIDYIGFGGPGSEPTLTGAPLAHGWTRLELTRKRYLMAAWSPNQLRERMANFWRTLLNTYSPKIQLTYYNLLPSGPTRVADSEKLVTHVEWVQFEEFRSRALSTFRDVIDASIHAAPMRIYLDLSNNNNVNFPNENYARELLELHTLGEGNYTQTDVQLISQALVGLGIKTSPVSELGKIQNTLQSPTPPAVTLFAGTPQVANLTVPSSNDPVYKANLILDHIVSEPACADYICRRLIRYFIRADEDFSTLPMQILLAKCMLKWGTKGEIKDVISEIFVDQAFLTTHLRNTIKTPLESEVSQVRRFGVPTPPTTTGPEILAMWQGLDSMISRNIDMGQWLFYFPSPDGYPISSFAQGGSLRSRVRWESGYRIWNLPTLITSGDPFAFVSSLGATMSNPDDIVTKTFDHLFPNDYSTGDKDGAREILDYDPTTGALSPWPTAQTARTERLRVMLGYVAGLTQMMIK